MTVLPFTPAQQAAPAPVPATPAGTGNAGPGDFLAAFLAAMGTTPSDGPVAGDAPGPVEVAPPPVEEVALGATGSVEQGAQAAPRVVEEGALAPVSKPSAPDETDPVLVDPTLAAVAALQNLMAPQLAAAVPATKPEHVIEETAQADPRVVEEGALAPVSKPLQPPAGPAPDLETAAAQPPRSTEQPPQPADLPADSSPELAVAGLAAPPKEHTSVPAEVAGSSVAVPNLPATAIQSSPTANLAPAAVPTAPPVANTAPLDRVAQQVFGEVTSLVSRGNGTHRIAMTLNPEQLGEVRVVMTVRDGAVHVRMAAGHEARAALLDGSPELSRLLETSGATETRIVVRDLPATAPTPTTPTTDSTSAGNGSPDQRAGTRADHQARDGSDHNSPRSTRTDGSTSTAAVARPSQSVTGTRLAGVDLTM